MSIRADAAQVEQALINLLHNAAEASLRTRGAVTIGWKEAGECVEIFVRDEGDGIMNPTNLFVPFFTTKPGGSGIGLALSRQIAEAHGGTLNAGESRGRAWVRSAVALAEVICSRGRPPRLGNAATGVPKSGRHFPTSESRHTVPILERL